MNQREFMVAAVATLDNDDLLVTLSAAVAERKRRGIQLDERGDCDGVDCCLHPEPDPVVKRVDGGMG